MATPKEIFDTKIGPRISSEPDNAKKVNAVYMFDLTGDGGGQWTVNLKDAPGVTEGDAGNAQCTITCAASDFVDIVEKRANAQMLFMSGKLKIKGDMSLAMKLGQVLG